MNIIVSRLGPSDAEFAAKVVSRFALFEASVERVALFLVSEAHFLIVAKVVDVAAGFAYAYELQRLDGNSMLFLYSIDVAPEYRRRGVATALLSHLRQAAGQGRMKKLFVVADRSNEAAVAFYRATGGIVEGGDSLCFVYSSPAPPNIG